MDAKKLIPTNEHPIERLLRVIIGVVLLALVVVGPKTYWGLLGLVPLATGLLGSCPLYTLFGLSTCPVARGPGAGGVSTKGART